MKYRAITRNDALTLIPAELATVEGGPMACLARAALPQTVSIADISFDDEAEQEDRETEVDFIANDVPPARRTISRWASTAGHRRLWFRDEMVEVEPSEATHRDFVTTCSCCGFEIRDSWSALMKFVQAEGHFPYSCFVCGAFVPQWEPVRVEAVDRRAGSSRPRTRGSDHGLRAVDA